MKLKRLLGTLLVLGASGFDLHMHIAAAQTIDYAALEALFEEPVTTSVTGSPQRVSEVPATMEIVTAQEIQRSGAHSVAEVLAHVAGVDVLRFTAGQTEIGLRGYDQAFSPRLLVLIDGRQVYADFYGLVPWSGLPVELGAIRQIEIVKGPNSALFGFNAVDGVINIVTRNPLNDPVNQVEAVGGTQGFAEVSGIWNAKPNADSALRLMAGLRSNNQFDSTDALGRPPAWDQSQRRAEVALTGIYRLSSTSQLNFDATASQSTVADFDPTYYMLLSRTQITSLKAQYIADTPAGLLQLTSYLNWMGDHGQLSIFQQPTEFSNHVAVVQAQDVLRLGAWHTLRGSLEVRQTSETTTPFSGGNVSYRIFSAGLMWEWRLSDALTWTQAGRIDSLTLGRKGSLPPHFPFTNDDWDRRDNEVSFNEALVWQRGTSDVFRLTTGRGVLVPNLLDAGGFYAQTQGVNLAGVPTLHPTRVNNYELAWDHQIDQQKLLLRASIFHQDSNDLIANLGATIMTQYGIYFTPANIGDSHATGFELSIGSRRSSAMLGWHWQLSDRVERISDKLIPAAANGAAEVDFEHVVPRNLARFNVGWANPRWQIDGYARYQSHTEGLLGPGDQFGALLLPLPGYVAADARIAYHFNPHWQIWMVGQNLLERGQRQSAGLAVEPMVTGGLTLNF